MVDSSKNSSPVMNTALQKDASGSKFKTEVENEGIAKIGVSYELGQHNYTVSI